MYSPALSRLVVGVLGLLVLPILALATACGATEEAKPRPLPEDDKALQPGEYRSEEFEPSLSFQGRRRLGKRAPGELRVPGHPTGGDEWGVFF